MSARETVLVLVDSDGQLVGRFSNGPNEAPLQPAHIVSYQGALFVYRRPIPMRAGARWQAHEYQRAEALDLTVARKFENQAERA